MCPPVPPPAMMTDSGRPGERESEGASERGSGRSDDPAAPSSLDFDISCFDSLISYSPCLPLPRSPARYFSSSTPCSDTFNKSEEHTSELQSRPHLVCRLLLEKK